MKIINKLFTLPALLLCISINAEPFDSTYIAKPSATSLLKNANIYDGEGNEFFGHDLLIVNGKIEAIGLNLLSITDNTVVYDLSGTVSYTHLTLPTNREV